MESLVWIRIKAQPLAVNRYLRFPNRSCEAPYCCNTITLRNNDFLLSNSRYYFNDRVLKLHMCLVFISNPRVRFSWKLELNELVSNRLNCLGTITSCFEVSLLLFIDIWVLWSKIYYIISAFPVSSTSFVNMLLFRSELLKVCYT